MTQDEIPKDEIADDEILYRRVPLNKPPTFYFSESDGRRQVESAAFGTRLETEGEYAGRYCLSVDRARLCAEGPVQTRGTGLDGSPAPFGVICFSAGLARAVPGVDLVVADADLDNPAHALVCSEDFSTLGSKAERKAASRLRNALADRVNAQAGEFWVLLPPADSLA